MFTWYQRLDINRFGISYSLESSAHHRLRLSSTILRLFWWLIILFGAVDCFVFGIFFSKTFSFSNLWKRLVFSFTIVGLYVDKFLLANLYVDKFLLNLDIVFLCWKFAILPFCCCFCYVVSFTMDGPPTTSTATALPRTHFHKNDFIHPCHPLYVHPSDILGDPL